MSYNRNPYYHPEEFNLEIVGEVEWSEPDYSFDFSVVWKHKETGRYYTLADSGCSCPTPFEDVDALEDLEGPFNAFELMDHLQSMVYTSARTNDDIAQIAERLNG